MIKTKSNGRKDHKYSIGEKLVLREDLKPGQCGGRYRFVNEMNRLRGTVVTIKDYIYENCYHIEEMMYGWEEDWFMPYVQLEDDLFEI